MLKLFSSSGGIHRQVQQGRKWWFFCLYQTTWNYKNRGAQTTYLSSFINKPYLTFNAHLCCLLTPHMTWAPEGFSDLKQICNNHGAMTMYWTFLVSYGFINMKRHCKKALELITLEVEFPRMLSLSSCMRHTELPQMCRIWKTRFFCLYQMIGTGKLEVHKSPTSQASLLNPIWHSMCSCAVYEDSMWHERQRGNKIWINPVTP